MRWYKWFKKQDKDVMKESFIKGGKFRDFDKLSETEKLIMEGIAYGFKTNLKNIKATIPFDIYLITEEKLLEFKNNFGYEKNTYLRHLAYVGWMNSLGLSYTKHRAVVSKIIRGIYEYTNGKLDYRNPSMVKKDAKKQN